MNLWSLYEQEVEEGIHATRKEFLESRVIEAREIKLILYLQWE